MSKYKTDIEHLTCKCPDWVYRRYKFSKSDERRICKHLAEEIGVTPSVTSESNKWSEKKRHDRAYAQRMVKIITNALSTNESVDKFEFCGSYRRKKDTVGDIDVIIVKKNDDWSNNLEVLNSLTSIAEKVMVSGEQKTSLLLGGIQVDLRFVKSQYFVFQLMHATGSKDENVRLRRLAKKNGMMLNEYGLFKDKIAIPNLNSEQAVYKALGTPFVKPDAR